MPRKSISPIPLAKLYGGLVFSARLSVRADDKHSVGERAILKLVALHSVMGVCRGAGEALYDGL